MTIDEIIAELSEFKRGYFPAPAIEAAKEQWLDLLPHVEAMLKKMADEPKSLTASDCDFAFWAFYLLGEQKSTEHLPLLLSACRDEYLINLVLDDAITENLSAILFAMVGNSEKLLRPFILDNTIDLFVRNAAKDVLFHLCHENRLARTELHDFINSMITAFSSMEDDYLLTSLAHDCLDHGFNEFKTSFIALAKQEKLDLTDSEINEFDEWQKDGKASEYNSAHFDFDIMSLSTWPCYTEKDDDDFNVDMMTPLYDDDEEFNYYEPKVIEQAVSDKNGRNDPCPCGSGKKYKKCCLKNK